MEEMKTTIIADLEKYAHELPGKPAVCDKKRQLTYQELVAGRQALRISTSSPLASAGFSE